MAAIIIGLVLSIFILIFKQYGRNIRFKILSLFICSIICLLLLLLTDWGWWYVILLPACTFIGVFLSLIISPLTLKEAFNSRAFEINDYYNKLSEGEQIGIIKTYYGFKQGYERLLKRNLYAFTSSNNDTIKIMQNLYSNIYYPLSKTSKETLVIHVHKSLDKAIDESVYLTLMKRDNPNIYEFVFNIFICILQINEEATDNIKRIKKGMEEERLLQN